MREAEHRIETARPWLRPLSAADLDALVDLDSDPEVRRYVDGPDAPSRAEVLASLPRLLLRFGPTSEPAFWAAVEKESGGFCAEARAARKEHKPETSAVEMATGMGVELLTEERYRELQRLGEFDTKTSSWIETPADVRALGGALFCDRRYGRVFVYHNGAQSYYAAGGFRGLLRV